MATLQDTSRNTATASSSSHPTNDTPLSERIHFPRRLHVRNKSNPTSGEHRHHRRHHAKEAAQSMTPTALDSLFGRDRKKADTADNNNKDNANSAQQVDGTTVEEQQPESLQREVRPEEVEKVRKENRKREEELRESLQSIEDIGMQSTRQLDDTYYAILEKASFLRSTVSQLQNLVAESHKLHDSFKEDSGTLEQQTRQSLHGFRNFDQQEKTINQLVGQLQDARGRTNGLKDRLESARLRVEAYEERENSKQATRRKRWHITWGTALGVFVLIVAVLVAQNRSSVGRQLDTVGQQLVRLGDAAEELVLPSTSRRKIAPEEDPRLQALFDKL